MKKFATQILTRNIPYCDEKIIQDYINRARSLSPEERLRCMGEIRRFLYEHMTPEGRRIYEKMRHKG